MALQGQALNHWTVPFRQKRHMPFRFRAFNVNRIRCEIQAFSTNSKHVVQRVLEGNVLHHLHMFEHSQSVLRAQRDLVKLHTPARHSSIRRP